MIQLILKDIFLQKKRLLYFPLLYNIFIIIVLHQFLAPFLVSGIIISYIMLQTAIVYEDVNKSEIVINSLPVRKEKVILARYLSVFVYFIISVISYLLISFLMGLADLPFSVDPVTLSGIATAILGTGTIVSIYLPVYYKYGYIKAKLFHIIFMMIAFILPSTIVSIIEESPNTGFVQTVNSFIQGLSTGGMYFMTLLFTLLVMTLSYYVSIKFYKKREF